MPRSCAYCGRNAPLTKEHVWPDCFLTRTGRTAAHFSHQKKKVHGADYVVGDVCNKCNNDSLSPLDAYFCRLYDKYFVKLEDFGATVEFEYHFELLARSLIKIAYNSARSVKSFHEPISRLAPAILGDVPMEGRCALLAELVQPTLVPDLENPGALRKVMPEMHRAALTQLTTPHGHRVQSRIVAVNSYYFHLLVPLAESDAEAIEVVSSEVEKYVRGTVRIIPSGSSITLKTSAQDGVSSIVPHIEANLAEYWRFFRTRH